MIYVIQDPGNKNIAPAREFGELFVILKARDVNDMEVMVNKLDNALRRIREEDWLLLIGDPVAIGVAVTLALKHNGGMVKILKWDRRHYKYEVKEIVI